MWMRGLRRGACVSMSNLNVQGRDEMQSRHEPSAQRNRVRGLDVYLPVQMNLREVEERVADVGSAARSEFLFELPRAYDLPKASITRLRSGTYNRSKKDDEYLWRGKVYYCSLECPDEELYATVDAAKAEDWMFASAPASRSLATSANSSPRTWRPAMHSTSRSRSCGTTLCSFSHGQGSRRPSSRL